MQRAILIIMSKSRPAIPVFECRSSGDDGRAAVRPLVEPEALRSCVVARAAAAARF
jgi:hypothetical protein